VNHGFWEQRQEEKFTAIGIVTVIGIAAPAPFFYYE
jgi:hypothetical protein